MLSSTMLGSVMLFVWIAAMAAGAVGLVLLRNHRFAWISFSLGVMAYWGFFAAIQGQEYYLKAMVSGPNSTPWAESIAYPVAIILWCSPILRLMWRRDASIRSAVGLLPVYLFYGTPFIVLATGFKIFRKSDEA